MWKELLDALGHTDEQVRSWRQRLRALRGEVAQVEIVPYRGYGTRDELSLRGRVLVQRQEHADDDESTWENVLDMYRRFASEELPGVRVHARLGEQVQETLTDEEGYFDTRFEPDGAAFAPGWHAVEFTLLEPIDETVNAHGEALVPPDDASFAVISDIDDTVLQTHATSLLRMARTTLLNRAEDRLPFPGVAAFYQALQAGPSGGEANPIFYLSSSPWNLYDLLVEFMALNDIPKGPLILQDYGFDDGKRLKLSHAEHKLVHIRELLDLYPALPFVLIGDSGEHDPELYAQIIEEYPGRIRAVYIRDVSDEPRDGAVQALAQQAAVRGVDLVLTPDSAVAAAHAAKIGLIDPDAFDA